MSFHRRLGAGTGPLGSSGMVGRWGASSLIASVQRAQVSLAGVLSNTATINAVNTANCIVMFTGFSVNTGGNVDAWCRVVLTNSTTVTVTRGGASSTANASFNVIEFYPGVLRSVQQTSASNNLAVTITAVDTNKSIIVWGGQQCNLAADNNSNVRLIFSNSTTVTPVMIGGSGETTTAYFTVAEFF